MPESATQPARPDFALTKVVVLAGLIVEDYAIWQRFLEFGNLSLGEVGVVFAA